MRTREADFTVLSSSENLFPHLFNPAVPKAADCTHSVAAFPASGGISLLYGISATGTKSWFPAGLGLQSQLNSTTANGHIDAQYRVLYFDFW